MIAKAEILAVAQETGLLPTTVEKDNCTRATYRERPCGLDRDIRGKLRTGLATRELRVDLTAICAVNCARVVLKANGCAVFGAPRH